MAPSFTNLLPIVTSSSPNTIWSHVVEDDFRRHLVAFEEKTNAVPSDILRTPFPSADQDNHDQRRLSLSVEKQIADDVAFIAAVTEGAQSVAAVCLEQHIHQNESTLVIRVAGMDVVNEDVRDMLDSIGCILQSVSRQVNGEERVGVATLTNQLFELSVHRHRQKLLGRMRSRRWIKPKHLSLTHKKPLWQDFANVIHRVQHIYPKKSDATVRNDVNTHLTNLQKLFEGIEGSEDNSLSMNLQSLIKQTYTFCRRANISEFAAKLEHVGTTSQIAAALKTLHQLEKIGAYWRIAQSLIAVARRYPKVFRTVEFEFLTPYASVPTSIAHESWAKSCHVHAEVQLTVDYALRRSRLNDDGRKSDENVFWPRTIGTSKYLCYLCHLFLQYEGNFSALNTHGRLYDQWTVPDLEAYNQQVRTSLADVLKKMDQHICDKTEQIQQPVWRAEPMTSRQDLLCLDEGVSFIDDVSSTTESFSID